MHKKLIDLGFNKINLGTTRVDSYASNANTTVHRYEKENVFVAFGLMGKLHQEITMGTYDELFYRSPMKELSITELSDFILKIQSDEKVMDLKHEDFI